MESKDVRGVQATNAPNKLVLSNGKSNIIRCRAEAELSTASIIQHKNTYWDNHLISS
jgi:hypothetical protein